MPFSRHDLQKYARAGLGDLSLALPQLRMRLKLEPVVDFENQAIDPEFRQLRQLLREILQATVRRVVDDVQRTPRLVRSRRRGRSQVPSCGECQHSNVQKR